MAMNYEELIEALKGTEFEFYQSDNFWYVEILAEDTFTFNIIDLDEKGFISFGVAYDIEGRLLNVYKIERRDN